MEKDEDIYKKAMLLSRNEDYTPTQTHFKSSFEKKSSIGIFTKIFKFFKNLLLYIICTISAIVGIGGICVFSVLYFFSNDLPNHTFLKHYQPLTSTRVFLQDGEKLCEFSNEKRYFVPIDMVPEKLVNAFIAVEDKHFYHHIGIDLLGISRSFFHNLKNLGTGKRPQGASTITQQVARIFLIKTNQVSYIRKVKEAILAYRIENVLSKKEILELYLNQIYLGLGSYGVAAAAKTYFDKTVNELTIAECAYLAILAKGANNYHPVKNQKRAIERRNWALTRMLEDGYISDKEYSEASKTPIILAPSKVEEYLAEYFSEEVRKDLKTKYPLEKVNEEGLVIRATLDSKLQKCAYYALKKNLENIDRGFGWRGPISHIEISSNKNDLTKTLQKVQMPKGAEKFHKGLILNAKGKILLENGTASHLKMSDVKWAKNLRSGDIVLTEQEQNEYRLRQLPKVQGAIVVIDVHNGRILAMQGGYSFAQSEFNRATQAKRQVGSAFKPFVYLAGLENGFAPNSIIDASPVEIDLGPALGIWKPRNYRDAVLDKITFRQAIEKSVNTATIRIAKEVGMKKIATIAENFGLFREMPKYFSYALGAGETTLLKLVTAYAMFANGGKRIEPFMIDYICDKNGKVIYKSDNRITETEDNNENPPQLNDIRSQIINEQSIYQLTSLLEGVIQRGSGAPAAFLNFPMAGKTGTSNDSRDTWFIGYTPDIAIGVFVGFDDHTKSLGKNASGTTTALPIFIDFMKKAKKYFSPKPFKVPHGIKLRRIDLKTGGNPKGETTIIEAFKENEEINEDIFENPLENLTTKTKDTLKTPSTEAQQVFGIY